MANNVSRRDCRGYKEGRWRDQKGNEGVHDMVKPPLHITERIWLRYAPHKFPFRGTSDTLGTLNRTSSRNDFYFPLFPL